MALKRTTMDFFAHQEAAKRKTTLLILYFILAVAFIICGVYLAILLAWNLSGEDPVGPWDVELFLAASAGVITVVLMGSIYKIIALSKGGEAVAGMLGATLVDPNTGDPEERKLMNVVEEMAVASGIPVPRVYMLREEDSINAFAAGMSQGDAVIAVTRGCMTRLTRDELQGVVAHEFSHILNGDMRLNLRLIGILNGILIIAIIGRIILQGMSSSRHRGSSRKGGMVLPIMALALLLVLVGYIGLFFGKLIKSAVSRQREFLADASAVQFTRNPTGIAGALAKIGGLKKGSRIQNPRAEEASHLFFSNGLKESFMSLLSTHPPIQERIKRIDPLLKGLEIEETRGMRAAAFESEDRGASFLATAAEGTTPEAAGMDVEAGGLVSTAGNPRHEHLLYAERFLSSLPTEVIESAREPFGSRALIYCLLLDKDSMVRKLQMERLEKHADPAVMAQVLALLPLLGNIGREHRLPLIDITIPALKLLSRNQYSPFRENMKHLVAADRKISLFEYMLQRALLHHLDPLFDDKRPPKIRYHVLDQVQMEATELLSILAWGGTKDAVSAENAFKKGIEILSDGMVRLNILPREKGGLKRLDNALTRISEASPRIKRSVLKACESCIRADARITTEEAELIRVVADSLDCPIPPIVTEVPPVRPL
ncbi:MAG: M48 family metallopeptidase [Pseudomonadota bacterium]